MVAIQPNAMGPLGEAFADPITFELMTDPVMDQCGHTFERAPIVQWIQEHHTCPISRDPLEVDDLIPNRIVRQALEIIAHNGGAARRIEELNVPEQEHRIVEEAAQMLHHETYAKVAGDCVKGSIVAYYRC